MKDNKIRLQKHLADCGVASRRKSEELIEMGKVKVNGHVATIGTKVDPKRDKITVRGKTIVSNNTKMYIMLHKPRGFVTTMSDEKGRKCVTDLVKDAPVRLFPVGRLDMNSEGLLIMTNDGEFANKLTHPSYHVNKTYRVTVKGEVVDEKIIELKEGIMLDGEKTLPCDCFVAERKPDRTVLIFIIQEGRNRQIRRMCEAVKLEVMRLKRTEIAGVKLGMLPRGSWRPLNEKEMRRLTSIT
ncbi:MAG: rRNA pseudouridine synthase [Clostridia bacterium]|nr:rRNA pseudouridine synthase [Clostridia bacterium]MBR6741500.1 rRNA pseudouridine synthase [Clostridia bacterium]